MISAAEISWMQANQSMLDSLGYSGGSLLEFSKGRIQSAANKDSLYGHVYHLMRPSSTAAQDFCFGQHYVERSPDFRVLVRALVIDEIARGRGIPSLMGLIQTDGSGDYSGYIKWEDFAEGIGRDDTSRGAFDPILNEYCQAIMRRRSPTSPSSGAAAGAGGSPLISVPSTMTAPLPASSREREIEDLLRIDPSLKEIFREEDILDVSAQNYLGRSSIAVQEKYYNALGLILGGSLDPKEYVFGFLEKDPAKLMLACIISKLPDFTDFKTYIESYGAHWTDITSVSSLLVLYKEERVPKPLSKQEFKALLGDKWGEFEYSLMTQPSMKLKTITNTDGSINGETIDVSTQGLGDGVRDAELMRIFIGNETDVTARSQEIIPGLLSVGSMHAAKDVGRRFQRNLHVTDKPSTSPDPSRVTIYEVKDPTGVSANARDYVIALSGDSYEEEDVSTWFSDAFLKMDEALRKKEHMLINCSVGESRSVTLVAAYLISRTYYVPDIVLPYIQSKRLTAEPVPKLFELLKEYDDRLRQSRRK